MKKVILHTELQKFVKAIAYFPISNPKSEFYDIDKIISIGQIKQLKDLFGVQQYDEIQKLGSLAQDGVNLCKLGDVENGYLKMQNAKESALNLSKNAYQYFHIYYLSCLAFYHFKQLNYKAALELTWQEIEEIEKFELKGVHTLHFRRAGGRMLNIIKVLFVSGQKEQATHLLLGIFLYSLNGDSSLIPRANWNQEKLNIIPYVRQRYIDIIFQHIVETSLDYLPLDDSYFYQNIYSKIPDFEVTNNNLGIISNWLYLQKLYHKGFFNDFIQNSIVFFNEPLDITYDILKLSLVSKVIFFLRNNNYDEIFINEYKVIFHNYIENNLHAKSKHIEKVVANF